MHFLGSLTELYSVLQESLDKFHLGCNEYVATSATCMPLVVSDEMKQYVMLNFKVIDDFEVDIKTLCSPKDLMISMKETLLDRFQDFIIKVVYSLFSCCSCVMEFN